MEDKTLREICADIGISRRAVQGYEKHGLVAPTGKNGKGHLLYNGDAQETIREIHQFQSFGFTVKEIKNLFAVSPEEKKKILTRQLDVLSEQKSDTEEAIAKLKDILDAMQ